MAQRSASRSEQPRRRARRKLPVDRAELLPEHIRLLEVVAEDLVALEGGRRRCAFQPVGQVLVEPSTHRLGNRRVRGIPDQEMPEAIRLLAGDERVHRPHELVAHEARQMPFDVAAHVVRNEGGNRAAMEHLALHGPSLQHRPHVPIERVDAGLQQRLDRRRHGHVAAPAFADHGEHLLDEQGVTGGGDRDPLAQCQVDRRPGAETFHQLAALLRRERLKKERRGVQLASAPVGTQVEELGAGNAKDEEGSAPGEVCDVLDEIEKDRLGPLQVVHHDHLRALGRTGLEQLAEPDARLLRRRAHDALRRNSQRREHLDERPVRDSLAIGQATAA